MSPTRKRKAAPASIESTDASGAIVCTACRGPHELRGCNTQRAVEILVEQGRPMSADEVRRRIESKETT